MVTFKAYFNLIYRSTPPRIQKRSSGSAILILVLVTVAVVVMLSMSMARLTQTAFSSMNSNGVMLQAQQYAAAEGNIVRYTAYNDLAAQNKTKITDTDFFKEVTIGTESDYTDTIKQKIVTVKIYKGSDVLPCYKLEVPRLSADVKDKGVPIGTVITWASNNTPTENGIWLECNGQSCAAYPELARVLGENTVPDYRGRFLESNTVAGIMKEAGLPNITGKVVAYSNYYFLSSGCAHKYNPTSALYSYTPNQISTKPNGYTVGVDYADQYPLVGYPYLVLNASYSNPIYGNSDTVQPASVTVRYFIRAA